MKKILYTIIDEGDHEGIFEFQSFDEEEAKETFRSVCKQHRDEGIEAPVLLYAWEIETDCSDPNEAYEEWFDEHGETLEESPDAVMISCEEYM